jgi:glycosyltransferase involved in cell wall biosynthesis
MHRSGTSALAGLLSQMGAIAPKNLLPPTTENPKGYWESKPIMQLNDDILKELGSKWSDWRSIDFGSFPAEIIESITDRTRLILTKEFPELDNAMIKDPRFCKLLPVLQEVLYDKKVNLLPVIIVRNPLEVSQSLASRGDMGVYEGALLWLRHMLDAERSTRHLQRVFISFEELMAETNTVINKVLNFQESLGLKLLKKNTDEHFINVKLRKQRSGNLDLKYNNYIVGWLLQAVEAFEILINVNSNIKQVSLAFNTLDKITDGLNNGESLWGKTYDEIGLKLKHYKKFLGTPPFKEDSLKALLFSTEKKLAKSESDKVNFEALYKRNQVELSSAEANISQKDGTIETLKADLNGAQANISQKDGTIETLKADLNGAQANISQKDGTIETLKADLNGAQANISQKDGTIETLKADLNGAQANISQKDGTIETLKAEKNALYSDITKKDRKHLETTVSNEKLLSKLQNEYIVNIQNINEKKNKDIVNLHAEKMSISNKYSLLYKDNEQTKSNLKSLKKQVEVKSKKSMNELTQRALIIQKTDIKLSVKEMLKEQIIIKKINKYKLFDKYFYKNEMQLYGLSELENHLLHYLRKGYLLGLNPHPLFDTKWYQKNYPDTIGENLSPLAHYVLYGHKEQRDPHPLFETSWFYKNSKAELKSNIPALSQFIESSIEELSSPHPLFDCSYYYSRYPDVKKSKVNALEHYLKYGHKEFRNPSEILNEKWYKAEYGLEIPEGLSALEYHIRFGILDKNHLNPNPLDEKFSVVKSKDNRKSILIVAHSVSDQVFGAERSLIDVLACIDKTKFKVHIALPKVNNTYISFVKNYVEDISFYNHEWWNSRKPLQKNNINFFDNIIKNKQIDIVYTNTIMLKTPLVVAKKLGVKSIMHIRELIDRDKALIDHIGLKPKEIIAEISNAADILIANSNETATLFNKTGKCVTITNAIDVKSFDEASPTLNDGTLRVGMLSSNIKKKGLEELLKLAMEAEKKKLPILFIAYGPETEDVKQIKNTLKKSKKQINLSFPGYVSNPKEALKNLDVIVNFSLFAESFGRTAVEAMSAKRPIIGYYHGALKEVIEHEVSGYHIQYKKPEDALIYLEEFLKNPSKLGEMGAKGYERALKHFSYKTLSVNINRVLNIASADNFGEIKPILSKAQNFKVKKDSPKDKITTSRIKPRISAVIPNYNYEHYIEERLETILNQTYPPSEIIFLDDFSKDNSINRAKEILERQARDQTPIPYRIVSNKKNLGVYSQWLKAIELAQEEWIWIAEADDTSHPKFLETLIEKIECSTSLVYCQSRKIDEHGNEISPNNLAHTNDISTTKWISDYNENGVYEVVSSLAYRNSIPNTSSAIFRKSSALGISKQLTSFRFCGDWFFYAYLLAKGDIGYSRHPYNNFRRHDGGVTRQQSKKPAYLIELSRIREYIAKNFPLRPLQLERMNWFLNRDYKIEGVKINSEYYDAKKYLLKADKYSEKRKSIAIITTNNGSFNGGSEMLWQETAIALSEAGHNVHILIKRWLPQPPLFKELNKAGIKIFFKNELGFESILAEKPDLVIVSIGDQDEGLEYYPSLIAEKIPYVIVNQLTKEPRFWKIREHKTLPVTLGYINAKTTFFTCLNNRDVMEKRLDTVLSNSDIHFNPYHIDRHKVPTYPSISEGYKIAIPSKLLFIHKGQDLLIDVIKKKKWKDRDVSFNFYGTGPDQDKLNKLIKKHKLKNCFIKGRIDNIGDIWKENHALCMPSRMEGLPIMIVSAMLSARTCIATDIGGHSEVITDRSSGFIVPNPKVEDLDKVLEEAYEKRRRWRSMGQQARKDILLFLPEDPVSNFIHKLEKIMDE